MELFEGIAIHSIEWLKLSTEVIGAVVLGAGTLIASFRFVRSLSQKQLAGCHKIRLTFARYLALALEFQLGADILGTAIAPGWDQIGKLGAIAVIRTGLNLFLTREIKEEQVA